MSKAFGLIDRFSEDIDIVVFSDGLGFVGERNPTIASSLSNKKRAALFDELKVACSEYIHFDLRNALASRLDEFTSGCHIIPDEDDAQQQTLLVEYPTLFSDDHTSYVVPRIKIEGGAKSALSPSQNCRVVPYIAQDLPTYSFASGTIRVIAPERTYWEKILILHGAYCGYRDTGRLPTHNARIARHYYDVAAITASQVGRSALTSIDLLQAVRNHNLIAFRQAWKRFDEAVPGSVKLVPQSELQAAVEKDYREMRGMFIGKVPDFDYIMDQLRLAENEINGIRT